MSYTYEEHKTLLGEVIIVRKDELGDERWIPVYSENADYQVYLASLDANTEGTR